MTDNSATTVHTSYTVFHVDGSMTFGEVTDWPESPNFKEIKKIVEPIVGGPMEHVLVLNPAKADADEVTREDYRDMFVDELGHVRAEGPKTRNEAATEIYRANWLRAKGGEAEELPWIAGDAVLFDRVIWR